MTDDADQELANVGYNEQLVLVYISKLPENEDIVNQKQIAQETGLYYATLKQKLKVLEEQKLVFLTQRGRQKLVTITEKGQKALEEWRETAVGKKLLAKIEAELQNIPAN